MARLDAQLELLLDRGYLDGVEGRSIDEIRSMRAECQSAETSLSFIRRLAQGRLDIVHAYLDRTGDGSETDLMMLVQELPDIIGSGPPRPPGPGRLPQQMAPDIDGTDLTEEVDSVLDAESVGKLPSMSEVELRQLADSLSAMEARVSDQRRQLHDRIDRLQAEIVSRYKSGQATVDGLLA